VVDLVHAVHGPDQGVRTCDVADDDVDGEAREVLGDAVAADEAPHPIAARDEPPDEVAPDEAVPARDEDPGHGDDTLRP
jgi:hypothetical protein